jgi:putative transposase
VRFAFITENRAVFPIDVMCRVLNVSRSGYYAWSGRPLSASEMRREKLTEQIRDAHLQSRETYGSPRVHRELKAQGVSCSENTVAKLMREADLRSKAHRRFVVRTTDSRHTFPIAKNTLNREFFVDRPNQVWVADITYVLTLAGWLSTHVLV